MTDIGENALTILRIMLEHGFSFGKSVAVRELIKLSALEDNDFDAADTYLLQSKLIDAVGAGIQGTRWLTTSGIERIRSEMLARLSVSLSGEMVLRFIVSLYPSGGYDDVDRVQADQVLEKFDLGSDKFENILQELEDLNLICSSVPGAKITEWNIRPTREGRQVVRQNFRNAPYQSILQEDKDTSKVKKDFRAVFVVHGRNLKARNALFDFLYSIGLKPLEWSIALASTGQGSPYIGDILDTAFSQAQAVVVLMTPEDEVRLHPTFHSANDKEFETHFTLQPRPNVLFEAGMAMGRSPDRTIIVELGSVRPFSDISGRHVVRLNDSIEMRQALAQRLESAGCLVDLSGSRWHTVGKFEELNIDYVEVTSRGIVKDKSGNLFWLPVNLFQVMELLEYPGASKTQINYQISQCYHHAAKLEINERKIVGRLQVLKDQILTCSDENWIDQKRENVLRDLQSIYDDIRQLVQYNQPDFDPGLEL